MSDLSNYTLVKGTLLNSDVEHGVWSDIAPVLQSQVGIVVSGLTGLRDGTYYNSASGYDQNIYCFAIFNQEPTIIVGSTSGSEIQSATYDTTTGLWYFPYYYRGWNRLLNDPMGADIPFYKFNTNAMFDYMFTKQAPQYNWQSVPSISGKNGISQPLSSHLDINDGEPITTSDTTKYSLNNNSNINKLVQDKLNS